MFGDAQCEGGSYLATVETQLPLAGICEEVPDFARMHKGVCPLNWFEQRLKAIKCPETGGQLYTGFVVIDLDPGAFVDMARVRLAASLAAT